MKNNKVVNKLKVNDLFKDKLSNLLGTRQIPDENKTKIKPIKNNSVNIPSVKNNLNNIDQNLTGINEFINFLIQEHMEEYKRLKNLYKNENK